MANIDWLFAFKRYIQVTVLHFGFRYALAVFPGSSVLHFHFAALGWFALIWFACLWINWIELDRRRAVCSLFSHYWGVCEPVLSWITFGPFNVTNILFRFITISIYYSNPQVTFFINMWIYEWFTIFTINTVGSFRSFIKFFLHLKRKFFGYRIIKTVVFIILIPNFINYYSQCILAIFIKLIVNNKVTIKAIMFAVFNNLAFTIFNPVAVFNNMVINIFNNVVCCSNTITFKFIQ